MAEAAIEDEQWCAVCGDHAERVGLDMFLLCDFCADREEDEATPDEAQREEDRQEARLLRWEASREEW